MPDKKIAWLKKEISKWQTKRQNAKSEEDMDMALEHLYELTSELEDLQKEQVKGAIDENNELITAYGYLHKNGYWTPEQFIDKYLFSPTKYPEYFRITDTGLVVAKPEYREYCKVYFDMIDHNWNALGIQSADDPDVSKEDLQMEYDELVKDLKENPDDDVLKQRKSQLEKKLEGSGDICDRCGAEAHLETHPEGQNCRECGDWVCDDCVDWKKSNDSGLICKECASKIKATKKNVQSGEYSLYEDKEICPICKKMVDDYTMTTRDNVTMCPKCAKAWDAEEAMVGLMSADERQLKYRKFDKVQILDENTEEEDREQGYAHSKENIASRNKIQEFFEKYDKPYGAEINPSVYMGKNIAGLVPLEEFAPFYNFSVDILIPVYDKELDEMLKQWVDREDARDIEKISDKVDALGGIWLNWD